MMDDYQAIASACLAVFLAVYAVRWYNDPLRAIPTVGGSSLPGLSYLGALRMQGDCRGVLETAYRKHAGSVFKVAFLDRWIVTVSGRNMVEELRKRADELSGPLGSHEVRFSSFLFASPRVGSSAAGKFLQMKHLFEPPVLVDDYHVAAVREMGRRELSAVIPPVIDEVCAAVEDCIVADEDEWTGVEATPAMQKIVARASSRAIVGLPLCRNDEYLSLAVNFTLGFMKNGVILRFLPCFLKPVVALFVNFPKRDTRRAVAYLRTTIEERHRAASELGKGWHDKPNDLLQSLLDMATARNESTFTVVQRLLLVNFTAIHTTSMVSTEHCSPPPVALTTRNALARASQTITHALYHLAEKSAEFIAPLREEIEAAVSADGWTATALGKMWKLDSVLRETLRLYGVGVSKHPLSSTD
uniref:Isoepoxydon dehydrogenase patN (IDH) ) n=1 Tax=Ganoderma boninense TaxID=34458 RepID=A0A5K1JTT5_9APHY|nr:Isoepoxydon dehydrogenase patN (IDH) (EC (Patulin biosynthesis cluster protein N) [Ganoderma boninense]